MDKLAVIIPVYNEAATIEAVVADYARVFPEAAIYVYDNNSTDDSAKLAAAAGAVVCCESHQGKGHVVRRAFREIDALAYVLTDGDNTYPAAEARPLVDLVVGGQVDMAIGDRLSSTYARENKRPGHVAGNSLVRLATNFLFGGDIKDIMTGLRVVSFEFAKTLPVLSDGFQIETEMTIHALDKRLVVANVPIAYRDRPAGSVSKLHTGRDGLRVVRMIAKLWRLYHPVGFFGTLSVILFGLSGFFVWPIIQAYWATGLVPRFPTLIVCGFVAIAGLLSAFAGLILGSLRSADRQSFEYRLQEVSAQKKRLLEEKSS